MLIVRIRDDDGATGYGDAVPMSLRGGPGLSAIRSELDQICAPALVGLRIAEDPMGSIVAAIGRCREAGAGAGALSALDIALLDLVGKLEHRPVWRLLGARSSRPVNCNGTLGADPPAIAAEAAEDMARAGYGTLKVKVGSGADQDRMEAVRNACGPGIKLRIDANGVWGPLEAVEQLNRLEPLGIELAEQPCATIEELALVRAGSRVPIVADESVCNLEQARHASEIGAMDAATLKLAKVGGVHAALAIAATVPSYLSSALDSALGIAAGAHAAQALAPREFATGLAHGLATSGLFTDNVADDRFLRGPGIELGDDPGLGVDVDEDAIERLRLR
jgi:L-alanine-DL-glutamate epimerase-like enolase superfamily enzyme